MTIQGTIDTLTENQKTKVYALIGEAVSHPYTSSRKQFNLDFLSNDEQKEAVMAIINEAIWDQHKKKGTRL